MSRLNIKPATKGLYHHQYNFCSVGSLDFGDLVPTSVIECVETDQWKKFHFGGILRLAPQSFPTYGRCFLKTASFFVPESQLVEYSATLHTAQNSYKGIAVGTPVFMSSTINELFALDSQPGASLALSTLVSTHTNGPDTTIDPKTFDFVWVVNGSGTASNYKYYKLTTKGKVYFKILKALGYDFASFTYDSSSQLNTKASGSVPCNAFSLLAYAKIYTDYFMNAQFYNNSTLVILLNAIHHNASITESGNSYYNATTHTLSTYGLWRILVEINLPHEQNMYTEAWNSANSPTGVAPSSTMVSASPKQLISPTFSQDSSETNREDPFTSPSFTGLHTVRNSDGTIIDMPWLSKTGLNLLNSLYSFVRRNNLFGSRPAQRLFARFGIKTDEWNANYAHKIAERADRIQFAPVMSNSDTRQTGSTDGKNLGSYAGMGVASFECDFNYQCNSFGYLVTLHWIQIVPIITRGIHPKNLRVDWADYYTPEYDGKAMRAIPECELSVNKIGNDSLANSKGDKKVFGFTNLYDDYRSLRDSVFGDFIVNDVAKDYIFARDYSVIRQSNSGNIIPQSNVVQYFDHGDNADLTQPFQMARSNGDRFYLYLDFEIDAMRPLLPSSDAIDLNGSGDMEVPMNGNLIN